MDPSTTPISTSERIAFLKKMPLFENLTDRELATLVADFRLRTYKTDQVIFHQDDHGHVLYIVMQGKVRVFKVSPSGNETSLQIFAARDTIGELAIIDGQPRSATAKAMELCQLLEIQGERFLYHMRTLPELALGMTRLLASKLRWTAAYAETIAQYDAAGRLLHILLLYNDRFGQEVEAGKRYVLDLAMNQSDLASLIGARREWVNRLLQDWHKRQLISYEAGKIVILNLPRVLQERDQQIEAQRAKW